MNTEYLGSLEKRQTINALGSKPWHHLLLGLLFVPLHSVVHCFECIKGGGPEIKENIIIINNNNNNNYNNDRIGMSGKTWMGYKVNRANACLSSHSF